MGTDNGSSDNQALAARLVEARRRRVTLLELIRVLDAGLGTAPEAGSAYRDPAGAAQQRVHEQELELARLWGELTWLEHRVGSLRARWTKRTAGIRPSRLMSLFGWMALLLPTALAAAVVAHDAPTGDARITVMPRHRGACVLHTACSEAPHVMCFPPREEPDRRRLSEP